MLEFASLLFYSRFFKQEAKSFFPILSFGVFLSHAWIWVYSGAVNSSEGTRFDRNCKREGFFGFLPKNRKLCSVQTRLFKGSGKIRARTGSIFLGHEPHQASITSLGRAQLSSSECTNCNKRRRASKCRFCALSTAPKRD